MSSVTFLERVVAFPLVLAGNEREALLAVADQLSIELGYAEGQNLIIEVRTTQGDLDRLPALAADLVQLPVDVIVAIGSEAIEAAKAG